MLLTTTITAGLFHSLDLVLSENSCQDIFCWRADSLLAELSIMSLKHYSDKEKGREGSFKKELLL